MMQWATTAFKKRREPMFGWTEINNVDWYPL